MNESAPDGDSPADAAPLPGKAWRLFDLGLDDDAEAANDEAAGEPWELHAGQRIGRYNLVREMGFGGFGTVWLAEQGEPLQRVVALKLIKPGMDSRQVIARFEAERRTLSLMEHPNIAAVLDAGTTDEGRPFFVMEVVRGQPITAFCDEHRLSVRERLELFVHVCYGVQHAHQKAILHRDLKPSNILVEKVDGEPQPKIIDFGIAKALGAGEEGASPNTTAGVVIGTPEYMSPEQAANEADVDACSDIYSLGAILYELVTGRTPFVADTRSRAPLLQILRKIQESEPTRPSTAASQGKTAVQIAKNRGAEPRRLAQELRGDIDWIILKALERDRRRRYESAAALAADIQHCLNDEPVSARSPTRLYLLRKLVRRNKAAFVAAALVTIAVVAGATAAGWNYLEMKRQRNIATEESRRSQNVVRFLANMVQDISPPEGGENGNPESIFKADDLRALLDHENQRRLRDLQGDPRTDTSVAKILADAYTQLDELDLAAGLYQASQERLEQFRLGESKDAADCLFSMAWCDHRQREEIGYSSHDDFDDEQLARKALLLRTKALGPTDGRTVQTQALLAGILRTEGKSAEAAAILSQFLSGPQSEGLRGNLGYGWLLREQALLLQADRKYNEADAILARTRLILKNTATSVNGQKQAEADICRLEMLLHLQSDDQDAADRSWDEESRLRLEWLGSFDPTSLMAHAEICAQEQEFRTAERILRQAVDLSQVRHRPHLEEAALRKLLEIDATLRTPSDPGRLQDVTKLASAILADADRKKLAGKDNRAETTEAERLLEPDESLHEPYPREAAAFFALRASEVARREDFGLAISELGPAASADPEDCLYPFETAVYALAGSNTQIFDQERQRLSSLLAPDESMRQILWISRATTAFLDPSDGRFGFANAAASLPGATSPGHELDWAALKPNPENLRWICRTILFRGKPTEEELQRIRIGLYNSTEDARQIIQAALDEERQGLQAASANTDLAAAELATNWNALLLGMTEYRGGNFDDAVNWLDTAQQSTDPIVSVQAQILTAMNSQKLHLAEAPQALQKAEAMFQQRLAPYRDTDSTVALTDYITTKFLLDEAKKNGN